jgi:hypothetical protein
MWSIVFVVVGVVHLLFLVLSVSDIGVVNHQRIRRAVLLVPSHKGPLDRGNVPRTGSPRRDDARGSRMAPSLSVMLRRVISIGTVFGGDRVLGP